MATQEQYQKIYQGKLWYGNAQEGRCPGVRLLPQYFEWLQEPVLDLGCGRGHTVQAIRARGLKCDGIDQICLQNDMMVGDITLPLPILKDYASAICIDAIEHISDLSLQGLFTNLAAVERQVFSIHNGSSLLDGEELHINIKPFEQWEDELTKWFVIERVIFVHEEQRLYWAYRR